MINSSIPTSRSAFTLVELIVVISIATIAATMVMMNWTGVMAASRLTHAVETIVELDRQTRRHAINHAKPCWFELNPAKKELRMSRWHQDREFFRTNRLADQCSIEFLYPKDRHLVISSNGSSTTYFLKITNQVTDSSRWLFIAGGTGQHQIFDNEQDANQFWEPIKPTRPDAG
ncbi:MAG: prepilin-type N-terminal cleavage/methylation domain-containing protein [Planctomycetota bacterium]